MSQKVRGFPGLLDLILGTSRVINKSINWNNIVSEHNPLGRALRFTF